LTDLLEFNKDFEQRALEVQKELTQYFVKEISKIVIEIDETEETVTSVTYREEDSKEGMEIVVFQVWRRK
jgi:hypothetical protein